MWTMNSLPFVKFQYTMTLPNGARAEMSIELTPDEIVNWLVGVDDQNREEIYRGLTDFYLKRAEAQ
jgi:hypothetical protein